MERSGCRVELARDSSCLYEYEECRQEDEEGSWLAWQGCVTTG